MSCTEESPLSPEGMVGPSLASSKVLGRFSSGAAGGGSAAGVAFFFPMMNGELSEGSNCVDTERLLLSQNTQGAANDTRQEVTVNALPFFGQPNSKSPADQASTGSTAIVAASREDKKAQKAELYRVKRREKRNDRRRNLRRIKAAQRKIELAHFTEDERRKYLREEREKSEQDIEANIARLEHNKSYGKLKVCVCLSFMDAMNGRERNSLAKQLQLLWKISETNLSYSMQFFLSPLEENSEFKNRLNGFGYKKWKMNSSSVSIKELFNDRLNKLIVLSPDAQEVLGSEDLDDDENIFIIGGLVDRAVQKNQTYRLAESLQLKSKRLPLKESNVRVHKILNLDTVLELMAAVKFDKLSWRDAILKHAPKRRLYNMDDDERATEIGKMNSADDYDASSDEEINVHMAISDNPLFS